MDFDADFAADDAEADELLGIEFLRHVCTPVQ